MRVLRALGGVPIQRGPKGALESERGAKRR